MRGFFYPSSVVVIGVSTRQYNLGKEIARNLIEFNYEGVIHFVGREPGVLYGRPIHASIDEIAEPIDLAVILTPAKTVPGLVEQCGRKGIRRVIIEAGGFGEFGDEGKRLSEELSTIAARYDMRFIGPNCIGIYNASNGLATPFMPLKNVFRRGGVGIIAQSGGVNLSLLFMLDSEQIGLSAFSTVGNKLSVDENDLLEYFIEDPNTAVICLYLESIANGRRLAEIARTSTKPIVVHKANIAPLSRVIAASHTEALANDDQVVDAALRQAGMVRFRDMQSYLDFVKVLQLPRMMGKRLAIVSRSGGHAVMGADAAHTFGFSLPPFRQEFLEEIRKHLRADVIKLTNPLDLGDLFDFDVYIRIVEDTLQQETIDGMLFLHTYSAVIEGESSRRLLQIIAGLCKKYDKPVALCVSTEHMEMSRLHKEFDIPIFLSPERAVHALDRAIRYEQRRASIAMDTEIAELHPAADDDMIAGIVRRCAEESRSPLLHEALDIIRAAGIRVPESAVVTGEDRFDEDLGAVQGPFAVKVIAGGASHKSDKGGVTLGLRDRASAREACAEMMTAFSKDTETQLYGVLVQRMAPRARGQYELIVGGKRDPHFGPVVLVGHGGIFVEVFGKTSLRMAPLSLREVEEMIDEMPGSEILGGVRGRPPVDREALNDAILRVAHLMVRFPEIDQIDVNPIICSSDGAIAVDARVFLRTVQVDALP